MSDTRLITFKVESPDGKISQISIKVRERDSEVHSQGELRLRALLGKPKGSKFLEIVADEYLSYKYALVCPTVCQGLVVSEGDIYNTKEEAEAELAGMIKARLECGEDKESAEDAGFEVMQVFQAGGTWFEDGGRCIRLQRSEG